MSLLVLLLINFDRICLKIVYVSYDFQSEFNVIQELNKNLD